MEAGCMLVSSLAHCNALFWFLCFIWIITQPSRVPHNHVTDHQDNTTPAHNIITELHTTRYSIYSILDTIHMNRIYIFTTGKSELAIARTGHGIFLSLYFLSRCLEWIPVVARRLTYDLQDSLFNINWVENVISIISIIYLTLSRCSGVRGVGEPEECGGAAWWRGEAELRHLLARRLLRLQLAQRGQLHPADRPRVRRGQDQQGRRGGGRLRRQDHQHPGEGQRSLEVR